MPAIRLASCGQLDLLLNFMEAHPDLAKGTGTYSQRVARANIKTIPELKDEVHGLWKHLASSLNAVGKGCKKNWLQWRDYWAQYKYKARKKAFTLQVQLKRMMNGGGLAKLQVLSEHEKRVLAIHGIQIPDLPWRVNSPPIASASETSSPNVAPPVTPPVILLPQDTSVCDTSACDTSAQSNTPVSLRSISSLLDKQPQARTLLPELACAQDQPKEMPARKVLSEGQWELLLDYMEAHPVFAKGIYVPGPKTNNARWKHLACSLNAVGTGCKKTWLQWRDYWAQTKFKSRKKVRIIKNQLRTRTNRLLVRLAVLSEIEKRVLAILGIPLPELPSRESPLDAPPLDASPEPTSPPPAVSSQVTSASETSSVSSRSVSPLLDAPLQDTQPLATPLPTKSVWIKATGEKAAYESATSTTRVLSAPFGSRARKRDHHGAPPAPEWVRHTEERRIAVEEKSARALQGIQANTEFCASALQGIHIAQERMNNTLQGIQAALEASVRALQERRS